MRASARPVVALTRIGSLTAALAAIGAHPAFALPSAAGELIHVVPVPLAAA